MFTKFMTLSRKYLRLFDSIYLKTIKPVPTEDKSCNIFSALKLCRLAVTLFLNFEDRYIIPDAPPLWSKCSPELRQLFDACYEINKTATLAITPQVFHLRQKNRILLRDLEDVLCLQLLSAIDRCLAIEW